jgi:glutathionylspermidine synthase
MGSDPRFSLVNASWSVGARLRPDKWATVRKRLMFECCKWDIQSEDHSVVADFPLLVPDDDWRKLADYAEKLTAEVLTAEEEILHRPDLYGTLGLPNSISRVLRNCVGGSPEARTVRVMRFDFHATSDGWRISEVNADVPGGFIEASGFVDLIAEHYEGHSTPPNPAKAYEEAIAAIVAPGATIGLVHATAHSDDRQVMQYLAKGLESMDLKPIFLSPGHLQWQSGVARIEISFASVEPALLVRFFPAEWLSNLRHAETWEPWFCGSKTLLSNPGSAILIQNKRFPLAWKHLKSPLPTWKSLLPETTDPSSCPDSTQWVFKPVFGRVGEDIAIDGVTEKRAHREILAAVKRRPQDWIAQRRFDILPLDTLGGTRYVCLGIFTVNGKAAGAYGRIATKPLIDHDAQDIAVLLTKGAGS